MDLVDTLKARGLFKQCTDEEALRELLNAGPITVYAGFDPTADSMHVGHLVPVMALAWMQRFGHRVIAVMGGGTAMVGDPSGKTELRKMISREAIEANARGMAAQMNRFLDLDGVKAIMVDNADWLLELNYIQFLREIGRLFSVNRMLAAEAYKQRLEKGLSFIEFNYQILQAYDFLELHRRYDCRLQIGGDDQWGNILAGADLIRRCEAKKAEALTFPLITTSTGAKMGKTAKGAVWLDAKRLSPFDFYQYWINVDDKDVGRFLRLYTFLDLDVIIALESLEGAAIRQAKQRLAWELTTLVHGEREAEQAKRAAAAMVAGSADADLPTHEVDPALLVDGLKIYALLHDAGLTKSRGEGRRLIKGGAVRVNQAKIGDPETELGPDDVKSAGIVVRVGKKRAVRVVLMT